MTQRQRRADRREGGRDGWRWMDGGRKRGRAEGEREGVII